MTAEEIQRLLDAQREAIVSELRRDASHKPRKRRSPKRGGPAAAGVRKPLRDRKPTPAQQEWARRLLARNGIKVTG